jgi:hypothetical protein
VADPLIGRLVLTKDEALRIGRTVLLLDEDDVVFREFVKFIPLLSLGVKESFHALVGDHTMI